MVNKEVLQKFIDLHVNEIAQILPGGLKDSKGKWLLVCPIMERFDLDFSKVKAEKPEKDEKVVENKTEDKPKKKRTKKK